MLFLFAGRFKADPRFEWVPIDITAFFFLISVIIAICILLRNNMKIKKKSLILPVIFLIFALYSFLSLTWSPGLIYAKQKVFYIATLVLWSLMGASMIIAQSRERIKRFFVIYIIFAFWIAIESTKAYINNHGVGFVTALGGNYLGIGRVIGVGALIVLIYSIFWAKNNWIKIFSLLIFGYFMWILFVAGGRGPFISTFLACLVPIFVGWSFSKHKGIRIKRYTNQLSMIIAIIIVFLIILYISDNLTTTMNRILVLFDDGMGNSAGLRIEWYKSSFVYWGEKPLLGNGIGSWPVINSAVDVRGYPHNIILEIMVELGLIGLIIFIMLLIIALKCFGPWKTVRDDPLKILIFVIFINALVNAMVSGDIPDNRFLFFVLGIMAINIQTLAKEGE